MIDIKDIRTGKATITVITLLNCIVPGGLGLFLLKNELFMATDFAKLSLICIILSAPFMLVSFLLSFLFFETLVASPHPNHQNTNQPPTDTEQNDLSLLVLTNVCNLALWAVVGLSFWIFEDAKNAVTISKSIVSDFAWAAIFFFFAILGVISFKKLIRRKPHQSIDEDSSSRA